ncbi:CPBP family intramembrane metalloprotease [Phenylobacterium sp. LjRoot219]|uniref:CPBP family intramembrane glutamic endopeptidase n=1 Tax=Phenylobacterium sp. LjRoot219 TaxID=3342283 RepID=UPI003ECD6273
MPAVPSPARDFPFYNGIPVRLSAGAWLVVMAAVAAAFGALIYLPRVLPYRHDAYLGVAAFVALPLIALQVTAKRGWTALFHRPTARDLWIALAFAPATLLASAAAALLLMRFGKVVANPAAAFLHSLEGSERWAFIAGTAPQLLGEELITLLPFLGLLSLLHARGRLPRRTAVVLAWIGSSLIFGALHLPTYQWQMGQALLVIGVARLVLTVPYLLTKNIWVSTLTHVAHDWSLFAVILLLGQPA